MGASSTVKTRYHHENVIQGTGFGLYNQAMEKPLNRAFRAENWQFTPEKISAVFSAAASTAGFTGDAGSLVRYNQDSSRKTIYSIGNNGILMRQTGIDEAVPVKMDNPEEVKQHADRFIAGLAYKVQEGMSLQTKSKNYIVTHLVQWKNELAMKPAADGAPSPDFTPLLQAIRLREEKAKIGKWPVGTADLIESITQPHSEAEMQAIYDRINHGFHTKPVSAALERVGVGAIDTTTLSR